MIDASRAWRDRPWVRWEKIHPLVPLVSISDVSPREGWPGTVVEITGKAFAPDRDGNVVTIGGDRALVLEASGTRLVVMAGEATTSGAVTVEAQGQTADGGDFRVAAWPDPDDPAGRGAPRFFHGPQNGTPATNKQDQRILTILAYPLDHDPGSPAQRAALRTTLTGAFDAARDYWHDASYGSTTWKVDLTDWVALPKDRRSYFWEQGDIDDARQRSLAISRSIARQGASIIHGGIGLTGWIPVEHPAPLSWTYRPGQNPDGSGVLSLRRVGSRLFAGTRAGSLVVYDVADPGSPALLGSVALGAPVWAIDVTGNTVVAALGSAGLATVDVTNAAAPSVLHAGPAVGTAWATAVRIAGGRVYSNRGSELRVDALTPTGGLSAIGSIDLGAWITDIDIAGTTAAVATDGGGLATVELTAGGVLERGRLNVALSVRRVVLVGSRAYLAAAEDGLVIADVGDLSNPVRLGSRVFRKPALAVAVDGADVVVAVGGSVLVAVNAADPSKPTLVGGELDAAWEPDLAGARVALRTAIDGQALIKDHNRFYIDALRAWYATGHSLAELDGYEGLVVIVNGPFLRGQSGLSDGFDAGSGVRERFNATKGVYYIASGVTWDRIAHELIHWLGIGDIYQEAYADGTVLAGTAENWCLSGNHSLGPLFSAQRTTDILHWWTVGDGPADNVKQLAWSPTSTLDEAFELVAHGSAADGRPDRWHALRLVAASGLTYWVEVRQASPPGLPFDQNLGLGPGEPGRVVVIRATESTSVVDNTFERPLQLMGALEPGEKAVDAARHLVVTVESMVQADPLVYRVRVQWNQPIPDDPNGTFDLTITPWNLDTYETTDIWIDSTRRNPAGAYEFHEPGDPGRPVLSGDRPWVGHKNTIYARVRNTGPLPANDVWVSCYITRPPGIGDNGQWQILDTKNVATIPGNGDVVVGFDWRPEVAAHTCISVAVLPQLGEIATGNNRAQENVAVFDSASSSSHEPVVLEAEVRSPFSIQKRIELLVRHLPEAWHAVVDCSYVWLDPHGAATARTIIWTDVQTWGLERGHGERLALPTVEGWTRYLDEYRSIGGILAPVRAVPRVAIDFLTEAGGDTIYVWGQLDPPARRVPIVVELLDESGQDYLLYTESESDGRFHASTVDEGLRMAPGRYTAQAFTSGSEHAAETESAIKVVELT